MNWIDILILLPACWFGFRGLKNGFIKELASALALFLGIWITCEFAAPLAEKIGESVTIYAVTFVVLFFVVLVGVHFAGVLASKFIKILFSETLDHILGLLFGVAKVVLVATLVFYFVNQIDTHHIVLKQETKDNSLLYKYIEPINPAISNLSGK